MTALWKVFVSAFYRRYSGLFFFVFLLLFGIVNPAQLPAYHSGLMAGIISSSSLLAATLAFWLCYAANCLLFFKRQLSRHNHLFLHVFQAFSVPKQLRILSLLFIVVFLPVGLYALLVLAMALHSDATTQASLIALFLISAFVAGIFILFYFFKNFAIPEENQSIRQRLGIPLPFESYLLSYGIYERRLNLWILKLITLVILQMISYRAATIDPQWLPIVFLLIAQSHGVLLYYFHQYCEKRLQFIRNLPLSNLRIAGMYMLTILLVMLPEMLLLLLNTRFPLPIRMLSLGLALSQMMLIIALLYWESWKMKAFLKLLCGLFLLTLFTTIAHLPLTIVFSLAFSAAIFHWKYRAFEIRV